MAGEWGMIRVSYYLTSAVITVLLCSSAWAATDNCYYQQQQVNYAQRNVAIAENNVLRAYEGLDRVRSQVEYRTATLQGQVAQDQYQAHMVRSYPASYYGFCWSWNLPSLIQCAIARNNRRSASIRRADMRVYQAQINLQTYMSAGQRAIDRQAQRVVASQQILVYRQQQLNDATAALAQCKIG
jgi:hypothetical protein